MIIFLLCCDAIRKIMFDHNPKCGGLLWVVHGKEPSSDLQCAAISQITIRSTHGFWYHLRHKTSTRWEKNQTAKWTRVRSSPHCEMCGNSSPQPQQLPVMPAPVSGLVIFHPTADTTVEGERMCVFVWKAHLAERETYNPTPPPSDLKPPSIPSPSPLPTSSLSAPPSHLLPEPPEGRDGSVSGAGDVTLGNLRFWSSEEWIGGTILLCLQCMQTLVYACESWNSFCLQLRYCIQLAVGSFYRLLCRLIFFMKKFRSASLFMGFSILHLKWGWWDAHSGKNAGKQNLMETRKDMCFQSGD